MGVVKLSTAGILDYQKYSSFLAGNTAYVPNAYDLLETELISTLATEVNFTNLVSTYGSDYKHLQIRMVTRDDRAQSGNALVLRVNHTGSSTYAGHHLEGDGSSVTSSASTGLSYIRPGDNPSATSGSNQFGATIIDFLDAFNTNKNPVIRSFNGNMSNSPNLKLASGVVLTAGAVDSITLFPLSAGGFVSGSRLSLYGLKAA